MVGAIALGTLLNPLNSSMIAVALISLHADFGISISTVTWLVSGFYLAAAVGQPLMGRFADLFGPRRVFCSGLLLVCVTSALAPWVPAFGWLVALRVLQAFGTSAAYPSGLAIMRTFAHQAAEENETEVRPPASALGALTITGNVSAALGPTLGGFLIVAVGWPAIFLVNVPFTLLGLILALRWLPADRPGRLHINDTPGPRSPVAVLREVLRLVDLPGILLFSGTLVSLLVFLLSMSIGLLWLLLIVLVAAFLLYLWELRASSPFFNVRMLASNHRLINIYAQFATVNIVFYSIFFGLPLWLEQARGFNAGLTGLIMLPFAGMGILSTFLAVRIIRRWGIKPPLVFGAIALSVGTLLILAFEPTTPISVLAALILVLGIPNGFQSLGLQTALYEAAPVKEMGAAAGLFQTFRYVGSILSASLLGLVFGRGVTSAGLHTIALVIAAVSVILLVVAVRSRYS
jgi:MFS family permease